MKFYDILIEYHRTSDLTKDTNKRTLKLRLETTINAVLLALSNLEHHQYHVDEIKRFLNRKEPYFTSYNETQETGEKTIISFGSKVNVEATPNIMMVCIDIDKLFYFGE